MIVARNDDLKANPDKYKKFLTGIYKAVEYYKTNPADFIKLSAPHFNLSEADVKDILAASGLVVASGPSEAGVYTLVPREPGLADIPAATLARLRADPRVRFAEPGAR